MKNLDDYLPMVAILRGVQPHEVIAVADVLVEEGFEIIEVPMNSPEPFESIRLLAEKYGQDYLIGAGTVLTVEQVEKVHEVGGRLIVSPNTNTKVISAAKALDMVVLPGCVTPSEAFDALEAGADALKFFPATAVAPSMFKALASVLPKGTKMLAVGGVDETNLADFAAKGMAGYGLGSCLYKSGKSLDEIRVSAKANIAAFKALGS